MEKEKNNLFEVKQVNRQKIYKHIMENEPISKQEIVLGLQLSLPTVTQNLVYLKEEGLIEISGKITNTGGRNATAYMCVRKVKVSIGIDITENYINVVAVNLMGEVIEIIRRKQSFQLDDTYFRDLGMLVEEMILKVEIKPEQVLGVGIAVPGLVSDDGEDVTYGLTLDFTGETRENFSKYIPYHTRLYHDAHVAGYAEVRVLPEIKNAFYISLGNSVGGSVLIGDKLYLGESHKSGEIGHLTLVADGEQCYCGKSGCFDTYCSALRLAELTDGDLGKFFEKLEEKEERIVKAWDKYTEYLAIAITNIRVLFDCRIILGGSVGAYIENHMEELLMKVEHKNPFQDDTKEFLQPCKYKKEAIATGAAIMYVEKFLEEI